ncbi:MAG: low molecular weight phosphatase family protein [Elusimicrobia bacterium CG11_big_fil_rev_8_21_14_0_20_64_6]|nr:MAG: low molecular weight phosphatase family protein [Elusimicrobia bacterium CG11_big_fil_rev_8_21_14_0_20_64_6]
MNRLPTVLFVCIENSCRSQMAEAFARRHGSGRVAAWSAGSSPSGKVNETAVALMEEIGVDMASHRSKGLGDLPDQKWDYVITMGCGDACPFVASRAKEDWAIPDPKHMSPEDFRKVRSLVETKVKELVARAVA